MKGCKSLLSLTPSRRLRYYEKFTFSLGLLAVPAAHQEIGQNEAHVSAELPPPETEARISAADEYQERQTDTAEPTCEGSYAARSFLNYYKKIS